jgi:ABC-2 type transport system permease protein
MAFVVLLVTIPYFILPTIGTSLIPSDLFPYLWVAGVIAPFALFIQFVAILIAAGAMSEEYEAGTAEILLAKPVSRTEFFVGKYLGGYLLLAGLIVLDAGLSVLAASGTFGAQAGLEIVPGIVLVEVYASTLFYTVAFMVGEIVRRSSLAYILASALFFSSDIVGTYLSIAYSFTGKAVYLTIRMYLPTTIAGSIPPQYTQPLLPSSTARLLELIVGPAGGSLPEASGALLVAIYFAVAFSVALVYFRWADVSRRVS